MVKLPWDVTACSVALPIRRQTSSVGGSKVALVIDEHVMPRGCFSVSRLVTTAIPVGNALIRSR